MLKCLYKKLLFFFYSADAFDAKEKINTSYFALLSEACFRTIKICK